MNRFVIIAILLALILSPSVSFSADNELSEAKRIASLTVFDGLEILRIFLTTGIGVNPANCDNAATAIDIELNVLSRTPEEQQLMLNSVYLAFMTNRNMRFIISGSICSSVGTTNSLPVAVGVRVQN